MLAGALIAGVLATAGAVTSAMALPSRTQFRTQRLCSAPRPGAAECLGMRLIAKSLTKEELKVSARRQAHDLAVGVTPAIGAKTIPGGYTPAALHEAYDLPSETPGASTQTIGIVDAYNDPTAEADLGVYDKQFGLPECTAANGCFRKLNQAGKVSPLPAKNGQWSTEISLDLQMAHAICETCRIVLVEAANEDWGSLGTAVNAAVAAGATEVSNSYGGAESSGDGELSRPYYDHPGVVVTVSSGDCGYFNQGCSGTPAANFPAAAPHVVAVGGTSLRSSGGSWASTAWSDGGSGCSDVFSAALWQSAAEGISATGCSGGRSVADVAAVGDPYTGVDVYDSTPAGTGDPTGWGVWGGTSASSPIVAAEFALAGGSRGVSYPAQTLYAHLGQAGDLYDVLSGSNGSCSSTTACRAVSGYDGPTGVGSPVGLEAFTVAGSPSDSAAPTISGTAEQAQTLSAAPGEWSPSPSSLSYQWESCASSGAVCTALAGATARTLLLGATAVGHTVRVVVTATDGSGGGTPSASAASAVVASDEPKITGVSPASAVTGASVKITGSGLSRATQVRFGAFPASFHVISAAEIEATVPSGASSATITVTTPVKSASSPAKFTPSLSLVSESPSRAAIGSTVTITGIGFNSSSSVSFNGVAASAVTVASATSIKVKVPAGASTGPIAVTNTATPAGTVDSAGSFVVAP